eukprot:PhM_4_TR12728/c0_g1_i1/m.98046
MSADKLLSDLHELSLALERGGSSHKNNSKREPPASDDDSLIVPCASASLFLFPSLRPGGDSRTNNKQQQEEDGDNPDRPEHEGVSVGEEHAIREKTETIERLTQEVVARDAEIEVLSLQLGIKEEEHAEAVRSLAEKEDTIKTLQDELHKTTQSSTRTSSLLAHVQEEVNTYLLGKVVKGLKERDNELQRCVRELGESNASLRSTVQSQRLAAHDKDVVVSRLRAQISDLTEQLSAATTARAVSEQAQALYNADMDRLQATVDNVATLRKNLEQEVRTVTGEKKDLETTITQLTSELTAANGRVSELEARVLHLSSLPPAKESTTRLAPFDFTIPNTDAIIAAQAIQVLQADRKQLSSKLEVVTKKLVAVTAELEERVLAYSKLDALHHEETTRLKDISERYDAESRRLSVVGADLANMEKKCATVSSHAARLEADVKRLEDDLAQARGHSSDLAASATTMAAAWERTSRNNTAAPFPTAALSKRGRDSPQKHEQGPIHDTTSPADHPQPTTATATPTAVTVKRRLVRRLTM